MPQAKTEVALQFSECCAAETALQHRLFCSAEVIWTRSCAAANEKLHCNIEKAALQESGAFLPLSCGFQAPTFRHPRLGPADAFSPARNRAIFSTFWDDLLPNYTINLEKRGKSYWRKFKKYSGDGAQNCRFLSLVVVERVLTHFDRKSSPEDRCTQVQTTEQGLNMLGGHLMAFFVPSFRAATHTNGGATNAGFIWPSTSQSCSSERPLFGALWNPEDPSVLKILRR